MLSRIAIASLAFGSAGLVCSVVQSQFVHDVAFSGSVVPQNGHCFVSEVTSSGCVGASVYSIAFKSQPKRDQRLWIRQDWKLPLNGLLRRSLVRRRVKHSL